MTRWKAALFFLFLSFLFGYRTWANGLTHYPSDILSAYPMFYDGQHQVENYDLIDVVNIFYPQSRYLHDGLLQGRIPFWDPYSFCGHSLLSNGHSGFFYPLRLITHLVAPMPWSHDLYLLLHLTMAGTFFCFLLRGLGLGWTSSLFGGVIYEFNGFTAGWLEHEHVVTYAAWLPLVLHLYHSGFEAESRQVRYSYWIAGCACLGMMGLVQMMQFWAYALILAACWCLTQWWIKGRDFRDLLALGLSWLSALALAGIALFPLLSSLESQARATIPWDYQVQSFRELLVSLPLALVLPDFAGNPAAGFHIQRVALGGNWIYPESAVYVGLIPLLLLPFSWASRGSWVWKFFALSPLFVALVCSTPLFAICHAILPGFAQTIITRILFFLPFALSVLAALGLENVQSRPERWRAVAKLGGLLLASLAVLYATFSGLADSLFEHWYRRGVIRLPDPQLTPDFARAAQQSFADFYLLSNISFWLPLLVLSLAIPAFWLCQSRPQVLSFLLLVATLDPAIHSLGFNTASSPSRLYPVTAEVDFLQRRPQPWRNRTMGLASIRPNTLFAYQLRGFEGDESLYPESTRRFSSRLARRPEFGPETFQEKTFPVQRLKQRMVDLAAIDFLLTYPQVELPAPWELVFADQLKIFANSTALPDVYWVGSAKSVDGLEEALGWINSDLWNKETVVVEGVDGQETDPEEPAADIQALDFSRRSAEEVRIAGPKESGWVVFVEGFDKGWQAWQDGRRLPIYRANGMFMAIPVESGKELFLKFEPVGLKQGALLSLLTFLLLSSTLVGLRRSAQRSEKPHRE